MKNLIAIIVALFLIGFPLTIKACEIVVSVEGTKKETYKAGDVIVVKITVILKHRNCDVDLEETSINVSGSQITGATRWINTEGRTWERKIKIKILSDKSNKAIITAERTCEKEGGKGSLTLITSS